LFVLCASVNSHVLRYPHVSYQRAKVSCLNDSNRGKESAEGFEGDEIPSWIVLGGGGFRFGVFFFRRWKNDLFDVWVARWAFCSVDACGLQGTAGLRWEWNLLESFLILLTMYCTYEFKGDTFQLEMPIPSSTTLFLLVVISTHVAMAGRLSLRSTTVDPSQLPAEWRSAFTMLAAVVEDDDFQDSLREYLRDASASSKADYCRITSVVCDENFQIIALNLSDIRGSVAWQSIPKGLSTITVQNSALKEGLDLSTLPFWVKTLQMRNVTFLPGASARFRKRQSMLHVFECIRCNLHSIQWVTVPSLTHLDLSGNPLQPVDFGALPPTLRSLNLSNCNADMDAVALQSLPPPLTVVDISGNRVKGSIASVVFPSGIEILRLGHNLIEGEIQLDNLPFSMTECDLSHNKFRGALGDLSAFLSLQMLRVSHNALTSIMLDKLPPQLEILDICHNALAGPMDMSVLPSTLTYFDASYNAFTGSIRAASIPAAVATIDVSFNKLSGAIDLTQFSEAMRFAYFQHNQFEGVPDLTNLPVNLRRILIHDNNWESLMPPQYL
jgi:Leucine-rich repeat (LRR) protein